MARIINDVLMPLGGAIRWSAIMAGKEPDFSKLPVTIEGSTYENKRATIEINASRVCVTAKGLAPSRSWTEPLSEYVGVGYRTVMENTGVSLFTKVPVYYVELVHSQIGKTVRVFTSQSSLVRVHIVARAMARSLNLPLTGDTPAGQIIRRPEDLDKSIRTLAGEGKIRIDTNRLNNPPSDVRIRRDGDILHVTFPLRHIRLAVISLCSFGLGSLIFWLSSGNQWIGAGLGFLVGLFVLGWVFVSPHLVVTPTKITHSLRTPIGDPRSKTIPFDELHSVVWARHKAELTWNSLDRVFWRLILVSNIAAIRIGKTSRKESADWLGQFVMAAAAGQLPKQ